MSIDASKVGKFPWVSCAIVGAGLLFLLAQQFVAQNYLLAVGLETLLLGAVVFTAVHHAEMLALKVGEPYGSIIVALAVTIIETALIISQMLAEKPGAEFIGRDTVFSAVLIVLNGVVGICLVIGAARHHEQGFKLDGAVAALSVIATLTVFALIMPNYTTTTGPFYSTAQLAFVGTVSLILYGVFVFVQTIRHRSYFSYDGATDEIHVVPPARIVIASCVLLPAALILVVLFSKLLSKPIDEMIYAAGLPKTFVGVIIAALVLLPEGIAASRAAARNDLQTSLNLALGSAIATIGLTIPVLAGFAIWQNVPLALGIDGRSTVLLVLSVFVSSVTLATGRTTILQGAVHLVIFGVFLFLAAFP